jgi:hypothetical protein
MVAFGALGRSEHDDIGDGLKPTQLAPRAACSRRGRS